MKSVGKKEADSINWDALDQGLVTQECRVFSETPLNPKKCETVLTKLLYLIYHGAKFSEQDATSIFFAITKTFQCKEPTLRRLTYVVIRELAKTAQDVLIVTSSLTQDMSSKTDVSFRTGSVKALGAIVDPTMLVSLERFFKQALLDNDRHVAAAALATVYHFSAESSDSIRRWSSEIGQYMASGSKSLCQYLALGTLYLSRQTDRVGLAKLFQQVSMNSNPNTLVLYIRMYASLMQLSPPITGFTPIDLKPYLRVRSRHDVVAVEAARVMCELHWLYEKDIVTAVATLQNFLSAGNQVTRFTAIKILSSLASKNPSIVSVCNVDIELLLTDSNRSIATLAVTTLLKTGTENSIDRLIKQMSLFVSDISDEFKSIVVDAVKTLCLKFPAKYVILLEFLGSVLREEGGYDYKRKTVEAICEILNEIPESRETGLAQLCEFIEDCEYPKLTAKIIQLIGSIGPESKNARELVRYIYNRLILESTVVRVACVGAFTKFAVSLKECREDIVNILRNKCCSDVEDDVRDRAIVSLQLISRLWPTQKLFAFYDPIALESALLGEMGASLGSVPKVSKITFDQLLNREAKAASEAPVVIEDAEVDKLASSKILSIPSISRLGQLLSSHGPRLLNAAEAECHVKAISHIFPQNIVIEFVCANTIPSILLENIQIRCNLNSSQSVSVTEFLPLRSLKHDGPDSCFLILAADSSRRPFISVECGLSFSFRDFDASLNAAVGPPTAETCPLSSFEISFPDYVLPLKIVDFASAWGSAKLPFGNSAAFEVPSLPSIQEAIQLLVETFGCRVFDHSNRVLPSATVHSLKLGGQVLQDSAEAPFLIQARIANVSDCITLEIQAKSASQAVANELLALIQ